MKKKKLTTKKAKMILSEGKVKGHNLTSKQKKFFGAILGKVKMRKEKKYS